MGKPPDTPASRTCLVSHVAHLLPARLLSLNLKKGSSKIVDWFGNPDTLVGTMISL